MKTVVRLISVNMKSGRLISGQEFRKYREGRDQLFLYGMICFVGLLIGIGVGGYYAARDLGIKVLIYQSALSFFASLPTLMLLYGLIFTGMGQIRQMGVKSSVQPPYWLPITWEEHTMASIISHLIGVPLASLVLLIPAVLVFSLFLGELSLAILTAFTLLVSSFMASATAEIFRVLQVRFIGAVYKSSGKGAIWVRFFGSLVLMMVFYIVYFSLNSGSGLFTIIEQIVGFQNAVWFVPYIWLGMSLTSFIGRLPVQTVVFSISSLLFVLVLLYVAVKLNARFGLYEPPAITVSKGVYAPRVSTLGRLGFSSLEAALIKKDLKAFTRRRELMYVFTPLVAVLMPLLQYFGMSGRPILPVFSPFLYAGMFLAPGALMAMTLGTMIIGQEGSSVWLLYSSPISASNLIKGKYAVICTFSCIVMLVCDVIGILVIRPSAFSFIALLIESLLLIFAFGAVSLIVGIDEAEFVEAPMPRMVKPLTALVDMFLCLVIGFVILVPLLPYAVAASLPNIPTNLPKLDLPVAVSISAILAVVITFASYRRALKSAGDFLRKAET